MIISFLGTCGSITNERRLNTSLAITDETTILIDCSGTPSSSLSQVNINPNSLDTIILTHLHTDHLYGLPSLIHQLFLLNLKKERPPLKIIGEINTIKIAINLLKSVGLYKREGLFEINFQKLKFKINKIKFSANTIELFPVEHQVTSTYGLSIITKTGSKIVYSSDTEPCEAVIERCQNIDILIHECSSFSLEKQNGHTTLKNIEEFLNRIDTKMIKLVHLPNLSISEENVIIENLRKKYGNLVSLACDSEIIEV